MGGGAKKKKGFENIANIAFLLQTEMCHTIDFLYLYFFSGFIDVKSLSVLSILLNDNTK